MMTRTPVALVAGETERARLTHVGTEGPAPSFTATTTSGDEVSLATMRGHVTILDFWAVW